MTRFTHLCYSATDFILSILCWIKHVILSEVNEFETKLKPCHWMNNQRLEQLLEFLKDDPNDPFNLYAVANEYRRTNPEKSRQLMDQLLEEHPDYLPTYYHAAQLYIESEKNTEATQILEKGIALAKKQQDKLALRELQNIANELLFDD